MAQRKQFTGGSSADADKLRLQTPKGDVVLVAPADVLMAKSLDHWVNVLVKDGKKYTWFYIHSTLKNFLLFKTSGNLARADRFYGVNKGRVTNYSSKKHTIVFDNIFTVELEHPLPPYFI